MKTIGVICLIVFLSACVLGLLVKYRLRQLLVEHELKTLALYYHNYYSTHGRAPSCLEDLETFSPPPPLGDGRAAGVDAPLAFEMVREGRFVIIWDAVFYGDSEENEKYVLGYETCTPEKGGRVMRAGGSVRFCTAEEFHACPKIRTVND